MKNVNYGGSGNYRPLSVMYFPTTVWNEPVQFRVNQYWCCQAHHFYLFQGHLDFKETHWSIEERPSDLWLDSSKHQPTNIEVSGIEHDMRVTVPQNRKWSIFVNFLWIVDAIMSPDLLYYSSTYSKKRNIHLNISTNGSWVPGWKEDIIWRN